jgi:hypothetical protein
MHTALCAFVNPEKFLKVSLHGTFKNFSVPLKASISRTLKTDGAKCCISLIFYRY